MKVTVEVECTPVEARAFMGLPDVRATTATVKSLSDVLSRNTGDTEVRLRLTRGETARVFEIPFQVRVTADLYGELKSLLGQACLA